MQERAGSKNKAEASNMPRIQLNIYWTHFVCDQVTINDIQCIHKNTMRFIWPQCTQSVWYNNERLAFVFSATVTVSPSLFLFPMCLCVCVLIHSAHLCLITMTCHQRIGIVRDKFLSPGVIFQIINQRIRYTFEMLWQRVNDKRCISYETRWMAFSVWISKVFGEATKKSILFVCHVYVWHFIPSFRNVNRLRYRQFERDSIEESILIDRVDVLTSWQIANVFHRACCKFRLSGHSVATVVQRLEAIPWVAIVTFLAIREENIVHLDKLLLN